MKDAEAKKGTRQDEHRNKKPSKWPDYFEWMVRYAQKHVGPNDARAVANEALHDAFRSNRPKPSVDNEQATRRWLSCLINWRARDYRKREKRWKEWDLRGLDIVDDKPQSDVPEHSDMVLDRIELSRALEGLPPEDRTLFLEYYFGRLSPRELAANRAMTEKTLRGRVARATTKLIDTVHVRQRKSRSWRAIVFFLELAPERRFGGRIINALQACASRLSRAAKLLGTYACSAAMCMLMPGDVADLQPAADGISEGAAGNNIPGETFAFGFFSTIDDRLYAIPDKHQPNAAAPAGIRKKLPPSIALEKQPEKAKNSAQLLDSSLTSPKAEMQTPNPAEACGIAFGHAQTEFHLRQNAQGCLDELNRIPTGFERCRETQARAALRSSCISALSMQK